MRKTDDFEDNVLEIRRVTRVVAGGKRFVFRTVVVLGDRMGCVGVGLGSGKDVASAVEKGKADARKHVVCISLKDKRTLPYDIEVKYGAAHLRMKPAREGHGLIAGGAMRVVLDLAGVKDVTAKMLGTTTNKLNNARATLNGLKMYADARTQKPGTEV